MNYSCLTRLQSRQKFSLHLTDYLLVSRTIMLPTLVYFQMLYFPLRSVKINMLKASAGTISLARLLSTVKHTQTEFPLPLTFQGVFPTVFPYILPLILWEEQLRKFWVRVAAFTYAEKKCISAPRMFWIPNWTFTMTLNHRDCAVFSRMKTISEPYLTL